MTQDIGVISTLEEEDMKDYLQEVLVEIGRIKKDSLKYGISKKLANWQNITEENKKKFTNQGEAT